MCAVYSGADQQRAIFRRSSKPQIREIFPARAFSRTPCKFERERPPPRTLLGPTSFQNLICLEQAKNSKTNKGSGEDREKKAFILAVLAALFVYCHFLIALPLTPLKDIYPHVRRLCREVGTSQHPCRPSAARGQSSKPRLCNLARSIAPEPTATSRSGLPYQHNQLELAAHGIHGLQALQAQPFAAGQNQ